MDVLILTLFVSLVLVAAAVLFLALRIRGGDFDHGDRLSLLPLEDDDAAVPETPTTPGPRLESPRTADTKP